MDDQNNEYLINGEELPPEEVLTSLMEGDRVFYATGVARVKVGARVLQIPIRGVDHEEVRRRMPGRRPTPPIERVQIKADSIEGKAAGLSQNKWVTIAKEADPGYREALNKYNEELGYMEILLGLGMKLRRADGTVAWDPDNSETQDQEEGLRILKGLRWTQWQFLDLYNAIEGLTRFEEEALEKN